jgi:hypothetical protein
MMATASAASSDPARLAEVHVITRHGSRLPLTKTGDTLEEGGPGTLTALGQRQHYDLGLWLRGRYNNATSGGVGFFDAFWNPSVNLTSSALHRTVVSANSLALGLFPQSSRDPKSESLLPAGVTAGSVPVYTEKAANDVTIRGYEKCEAGLGLSELYGSRVWKDLEESHAPLLERLAGLEPFQQYEDPLLKRIPLEEVWNVYDAVAVPRVECGFDANSTACRSSGGLSYQLLLGDEDWSELQSLAQRAEILKYTSARASEEGGGGGRGNLAGGNMLRQILDRMAEAEATSTTGGLGKFYLYSAHYPTILTVLAALESDPGYWPAGGGEGGASDRPPPLVPDYAAALVFELYAEQGGEGGTPSKSVRVLYKPGYTDDAAYEIHLGRGCAGASHCDLAAVASSFLGDFSVARWCQECSNTGADVCLKANLTAALSNQPPAAESSSTGTGGGLGTVPAVFVGMASGVGLSFAVMALAGWLRKPRQQSRQPSPPVPARLPPGEDSEAQSVASTSVGGDSVQGSEQVTIA